MKKQTALLLALLLCISLLACAAGGGDQEEKVHQIGVIVYNLGDEEVISFREYLQGYIEKNFEMVKFVYSDSIRTQEEEMAFIQSACDSGVEGFLSFRTFDLAAEVALCEKNQAYYMLASGTVDEDDFAAVENNPWFLGMFGPGREAEYAVGRDMAEHFLAEHSPKRFFILSGGAGQNNEMHFQRTLGILDALLDGTGVSFTGMRDVFAASTKLNSFTSGDVTITVCPGYISRDESAFNTAKDALSTGGYDVAMAVLPPQELPNYLGKADLGIIDSFNNRNLQLSAAGKLDYVVGKYSSSVGPAAMLMLNAVTGSAEDFRDNGKAIKVTVPFWTAAGKDDYLIKHSLATSETMPAYNFDDLAKVCRIFNPDCTLQELVTLAEASSYEEVLARRGG